MSAARGTATADRHSAPKRELRQHTDGAEEKVWQARSDIADPNAGAITPTS